MSKPMHLFGTSAEGILADCKGCGRVLRIPIASATSTPHGYAVLSGVRCPCGNTATEILDVAQSGLSGTASVSKSSPISAPSSKAGGPKLAGVLILGFVVIVFIAFHSDSPTPTVSPSSYPSVNDAKLGGGKLQIGDSLIKVGDLADDAMPVLLPYKVGAPEIKRDPDTPDSLAVRHFYRIDGKAFSVELRRREKSSPYRVYKIDSE